LNSKYHHKYGLYEAGEGTGNYTPVPSCTLTENQILSKAVKALKKWLKEHDVKYMIIKLHGDAYQKAGLPDLLIILPNSKTLWVEFKRTGADTTKLQQYTLKELLSLGHYVGTCDNPTLLIKMVKEVLNYGNV